MERSALNFLETWLNSPQRLPLVLRGARQVGKTWLVRRFAEKQGLKLIELNFEQTKEYSSLFNSNDPTTILKNLEQALSLDSVEPTKTLLFLDEIQVAPQLYAKLRWFAEKMPLLPVIAAGSLLEFLFSHADEPLSMPVGRVEFMYLEPFSFEEFLLAYNKPNLVSLIRTFTWKDSIPELIHTTLMNYFREYMFIGGMPAVVSEWMQTQSLQEVSKRQNNIISSFIGDFHKYSGRLKEDILEATLHHIPLVVGKKFVYSKISKDYQVPALKKALLLLSKARICHLIPSSDANGIPLEAERNEHFFKVLFLDVGLCSAVLKLSLSQVKHIEDIGVINSGGLAEQVVGQLLRLIEPGYIDPQLYYWTRSSSDAEIDYVVQHGSRVLPIEVKAGKTGTLKSLHFFMATKPAPQAVRVYSGLPLKSMIRVKDTSGNPVSYELRSLPFYLLEQIHRLCD